jgi:hypothetical protein
LNDFLFLSIRIRTRVYAQGFVVSLLTAAAVYQAYKGRSDTAPGHKRIQRHNDQK